MVEGVARERIHLADWMDNLRKDWRDPRGHTPENWDQVYSQGDKIATVIGVGNVDWYRDCNPYKAHFVLEGWRYVLEDFVEERRSSYDYVFCLIKEKIRL